MWKMNGMLAKGCEIVLGLLAACLPTSQNPGEREYAVEGKCLQTVENVKYNMDVLVPLVKRLAGHYEKVVEIEDAESWNP